MAAAVLHCAWKGTSTLHSCTPNSALPSPARLTQHERVLHSGRSGLSRELVEHGAHDGGAGTVGMEEQSVEVGQQSVPAVPTKLARV